MVSSVLGVKQEAMHKQHQDPELLVLESRFSQNGQHFFCISDVVRVPADVGGKVNSVVSACLGSGRLLPLSASQEVVVGEVLV